MEFIDLKAQYEANRASIDARIIKVLEHGHYIMGPEVGELEQRLCEYTGAAHCIAVASGTEALLIALIALGVGPGDEVITTPFSFIATAEVIALAGASPVFVDVEADTGNIDAALIEARISKRTRAIMPVSLYGQPAEMDRINAIAERAGLVVIEDGAQSFGASYQGRRSGNLSYIGCTSFFPSKPLGCYGDGGALFTSDEKLARAMREIRVHGQERRYMHTRIGVGGRIDTLQCAILLGKLERFDWELMQRARVAEHYERLLADNVQMIARRVGRTSVHAQFTVLVERRDEVAHALVEVGIPSAVHYPVPIHLQPAYVHFDPAAACPVACSLAGRVLSLPMGPYISIADVERVSAELRAAVNATHRDTVRMP